MASVAWARLDECYRKKLAANVPHIPFQQIRFPWLISHDLVFGTPMRGEPRSHWACRTGVLHSRRKARAGVKGAQTQFRHAADS